MITFAKRVSAVFFSGIALLLFAPCMAVIALVMQLSGSGPVLFRQTRPGFKGRPFTLLKFRTMSNARDPRGLLLSDGERLTRIGNFLRQHSLDELPQLWTVFRGDMSLVGPRPLLMQYMDRYTPDQARRHAVKPGITGWAQVHGRNALSWPDKFRLDLWYVDNQSLSLDAWILIRTLWQVLRREGISQHGHATMPEFLGGSVTGHEN